MQPRFNRAAGAVPTDVHQRITQTIQAQLLKGTSPWASGIRGGGTLRMPRRHNGEAYRGINIPLLWCAQMENGFATASWMTYRQSGELGGQVRKGERGSLVVYANTYKKTEHTDEGTTDRDVRFLKAYTVFNVEQIEGLPEQYRAKPPPRFESHAQRLEHTERFIANTKADIRYGGTKAFYAPKDDFIRVPLRESFIDTERLYGTVLHEFAHWTEHPSRLNLDLGRKAWGDEAYAFGEIVAELTSAFLCADLEVSQCVPEDHAAYISTWLRRLPDDPHAIASAASLAQKAVDYLVGLQPASTLDVRPGIHGVNVLAPAPESLD